MRRFRFLAAVCRAGALRLWLLLALPLLMWLGLAAAVHAEEASFSDESQACLKCHGKPDIAPKKLEDGHTLSMHVRGKDYLAARHVKQDCTDCHSGVDEPDHGKKPTPLASVRALRESMQETCRDCHKKRFKQFEDSIHATLLAKGDAKAPLCASCHDAHYQHDVKVAQPIDKTSCGSCHEKIFKAYTADVHGLARQSKGKESPICADCHQSHAIQAASLGDGPRDACLNCHKKTAADHARWLPNTALHFEAISCVVCHAPDAERRVNLRLFDGGSDKQLREKTGVPQFVSRVKAQDAAGAGLDGGDLSRLLDQFSRDAGMTGRVELRGRLEVRAGEHAHRLRPKDQALQACDTCHRAGAEPFSSVVLSIAGADGRAIKAGVQPEVLGSVQALESVRGFYALGSTRIRLLDVLLVLGVAASAAGCLAHMLARRAFRGERERRAAARAAGTAGRENP